jgi:2-polyprenyl-3-methyl-5-hydroxy-6-metoxy-1,4-benzoquinol methylase
VEILVLFAPQLVGRQVHDQADPAAGVKGAVGDEPARDPDLAQAGSSMRVCQMTNVRQWPGGLWLGRQEATGNGTAINARPVKDVKTMSHDTGKRRKDRLFWDRTAEKYANDPIADEAAYQRKLEMTRRYFTPESEVLEFGCGTGSTAILHAPFVRHIHATDLSGEMLRIGRERAAAAKVGNITFEQAGFDDIGAEADSYDAVLGLSILHLLEDRDAAIARVYELVRPGGVFVSSTACLGDKMWFFSLIAPVGRFFGLLPMLRVFTVKQLVRSLRQAGFEIEEEWQPEKSVAVFIVARKPVA